MVTALHRTSRPFIALFLLAFMLAALVPAGFMPTAGGGKVRIVICTGNGPAVRLVDGDHVPAAARAQGGHAEHSAAPSCPYAPVLAQFMAVPAPVPAPVFLSSRDAPTVRAAFVPPPVSAKPWHAQAPPVTA